MVNSEQEQISEALPRSIGFWGGTAIMVGLIIGSGIFRSPASIAKVMDDPFLVLLLWLSAGIFVLFGALTYAELAAAFPRSGGIYVYLHEAFGAPLAFIFGWSFFLIIQPLALAALATVFSEHLILLIQFPYDARWITCALIVLLTGINVTGIKRGACLALVFTLAKMAALCAVIFFAFLFCERASFPVSLPSHSSFSGIVPVMVAILWTYDGWSEAAAYAGEVKDAHRSLPRILILGTVSVIGIYVLANAAYFSVLSVEEMKSAETVAPLVLQKIFGETGSVAAALLVIVSTFGAAHSSVISGSRVIFAQAQSALTFRFLGQVHPQFQTPHIALYVQGTMACLTALFLKTFERLTSGFIFTIWIFYGLAALSLIVLRINRPQLPRPYRCPGYPIVPLVFVLLTFGMTGLSIYNSPWETLGWTIALAAGIPVYWLWRTPQKPFA